jgi:hypothetical protein
MNSVKKAATRIALVYARAGIRRCMCQVLVSGPIQRPPGLPGHSTAKQSSSLDGQPPHTDYSSRTCPLYSRSRPDYR